MPIVSKEPLPPFVPAAHVIREAIRGLRPPARILVADAAEEHRYLRNPRGYTGPWRNALSPYLIVPMNCANKPKCNEITIMGPSQVGKSEVPLNIIAHSVIYSPSDFLFIAPTKDLAEDFSKRRFARLFQDSDDVRKQLRLMTTWVSHFRNGTMLSVGWPSPSQLASRPVPIVLITERDRMVDDVRGRGQEEGEGEGDVVELARNRTKTYGRNRLVLTESSPSRTDGTGIIALWREGSRELFKWQCKECFEWFAPGFDLAGKPTLDFFFYDADPDKSIEQRAKNAYIGCPHCGAAHEEKDKPKLNLRGLWVGEGQTVTREGVIEGDLRSESHRSFWIHGFISQFTKFSEIAEKLMKAQEYQDQTGDSGKMRTVYNTSLGIPYEEDTETAPLDADGLRARADEMPMRVVPRWARFLTAAVDIQAKSFEVGVYAWNEKAEGRIIDRFSLSHTQDGRALDPGEYPEDWHTLLDEVIYAKYPWEDDEAKGLPIATTAIDTGGVDGVTENAKAFWRYARAKGVADIQIMLIKGARFTTAPTVGAYSYDKDRKGKPIKTGVYIVPLGVHELKNILDKRLRRETPGPGYVHLSAAMPSRYFDELCAERKEKGVWERHGANETWDISVYNIAAWMRLKPYKQRFNTRPPKWAKQIIIDRAGEAAEQTSLRDAEPAMSKRTKTARRRKRKSGFVNNRRK